MAANIGSLSVSLTAKTERFDAGLKAANDNVAKFRKQITGSGGTVTGGSRQAGKALENVNKQAGRAGAALKGAIGGGGVLLLGKQLADADSRLALLRARLDVLGGADISFNRLEKAARKSGVSMETVAQFATRLLQVKDVTGTTNEEILQMTENFFALGRLGGQTGQELEAAALQFAQGFGSLELMGEELRSVREQAPLVARALADALGIGLDQLKSAGASGAITADVMKRALTNVEGIDESLAKMPESVSQINARLGDATTRLLAAAGASKAWGGTLNAISSVMDFIRTRMIETESDADNLEAKIQRLKDVLSLQQEGTPFFDQLSQQIQDLEDKLASMDEEANKLVEGKKVESGFFSGFRDVQKEFDLTNELLSGKKGAGGLAKTFTDALDDSDRAAFGDFLDRIVTEPMSTEAKIEQRRQELAELKKQNTALDNMLAFMKGGTPWNRAAP